MEFPGNRIKDLMKIVIVIAMSLVFNPGCSKVFLDDGYYKKEIFSENYMGIYGTWKLIGSGGGISGDFQADFDKLVIYSFGNFHKMRNDTVLQKGIIAIIEQDPNKLKVDFIPLYAIPTSSKWVTFQGADTLRLDDTCIDCNYYVLVREQ